MADNSGAIKLKSSLIRLSERARENKLTFDAAYVACVLIHDTLPEVSLCKQHANPHPTDRPLSICCQKMSSIDADLNFQHVFGLS